MIDTHCHLTYEPLIVQLDAVLERAKSMGVDRMISIGTQPADAARSNELAHRYPSVFSTIGVHPHYAAGWQDAAVLRAALIEGLARPRVVAIGEMGLDRHYPEPGLDLQRRTFETQLAVMAETTFPGVIHGRQTTFDIIEMLRGSGIAATRFVFHCFTGTGAELDAILEFGAMVSFTGVVTFANSAELAAGAARVPLDRIMIETDAPYLTPAPFRKIRVNEPYYLHVTAKSLAEKRGLSLDDFVAAVDANAVRFFRLP
jgi:TatD DNase family protein